MKLNKSYDQHKKEAPKESGKDTPMNDEIINAMTKDPSIMASL